MFKKRDEYYERSPLFYEFLDNLWWAKPRLCKVECSCFFKCFVTFVFYGGKWVSEWERGCFSLKILSRNKSLENESGMEQRKEIIEARTRPKCVCNDPVGSCGFSFPFNQSDVNKREKAHESNKFRVHTNGRGWGRERHCGFFSVFLI